jgi:hypothetical protein
MLGGLWYSPALFANRWIALQGKTREEFHAMSGRASPMMFVQVFICGLVIAIVVAIAESRVGALTVATGACVGVLLWLVAGATSYGTALFSYQPRALWAINTGYNLVSMVVAGVILAVWR